MRLEMSASGYQTNLVSFQEIVYMNEFVYAMDIHIEADPKGDFFL